MNWTVAIRVGDEAAKALAALRERAIESSPRGLVLVSVDGRPVSILHEYWLRRRFTLDEFGSREDVEEFVAATGLAVTELPAVTQEDLEEFDAEFFGRHPDPEERARKAEEELEKARRDREELHSGE